MSVFNPMLCSTRIILSHLSLTPKRITEINYWIEFGESNKIVLGL